MKKTWYSRMLLSYVPMFFLVTSFLFFLVFQSLAQQKEKEIVSVHEFLTLQIMNAVDANLKSIDEMFTRSMINDPLFNEFFQEGDIDNIVLNFRLVRKMKEVIGTFPVIENIYLVHFDRQFVVSNDFVQSLEHYPDRNFIMELSEKKSSLRWSDVRPFRNYTNKPYTNVVTYVQYDIDQKGMIVINVNTARLEKLVEQHYDLYNGYVRFIDRKGQLISNLAITEETESGIELASYVSPYTGWRVESGYIGESRIMFMPVITDIWVVLGFLSVLAGGLWFVYATRMNYKPIQHIVARLDSFKHKKLNQLVAKKHMNEFLFIEQAFNDMMEQSDNFRKQLEEESRYETRYFFHELLEGLREITTEEWTAKMEELPDLPSPSSLQVVLAVEIDNYEEFDHEFSIGDQKLLKYVLKRVVYENAQQNELRVWSDWTSHHQLAVILFFDQDQQSQGETVEKWAANLKNWVKDHLKFTVSIGIGARSHDPASIRESYKEALKALDYKAVLGSNRIILYENTGISESKKIYAHFEHIQTIVHNFRLHDPRWKKELGRLLKNMKAEWLSRHDMLNLIHYLLYYMDREMMKMAKEYYHLWKETEIHIQSRLSHMETLEKIECLLQKQLDCLSETLQQTTCNRKTHRLMNEIRQYIEQTYTDPDLSLEHLSDKFNISIKILSRDFKEEFGEKFLDFVIDLRINHAKQRLAECDEPIQSIAEEIGYASSISFSRVFKRVVGISPGKYREEIRNNSGDLPLTGESNLKGVEGKRLHKLE